MLNGVMIIAIGLAVFCVVALTCGLLLRIRLFEALLDHPNVRSLHVTPVPRIGGLALLTGLIAGMVALWGVDVVPVGSAWMMLVALLYGIVSLCDDIRSLPWGWRLSLHIVLAVLLVGAGFRLDELDLPGVGRWALGGLALPISVLLVVWFANLFNFMDGMDGLAAGMGMLGFGAFSVIGWINGATDFGGVAVVVAAACGGVLVWNFPPASLFMGDSGSVPLGVLAATMTLWGVDEKLFAWWVPIVIFGPFVVDATTTLIKRILAGRRFWHAHREHYYQRLAIAVGSHKIVLLGEYGLMLVCASCAIILTCRINELWQLVILICWGIFMAALLHFVDNRLAGQRGVRSS